MDRGKEDAKELKKESFMQGVLALMFSQVLIKILGLVYKLYLTNKEGFGDSGNAIYSAGFGIYALLLTLSSIGVPNAISKLISERVAIGDYKGANRVFKIAFATFSCIGLVGTLILFFGAEYIANVLIQIPEAQLTLVALSPSIFFVSVCSVIRGYLNGKRNMKATAKSQTLEQVFKALLTVIVVEILFIFTNADTKIMAAGANLATTFATFLSFAYLFLYYKNEAKVRKEEYRISVGYKYERITTIIKRILYVSLPMSLSAIMSSLNKNIDSITVVRGLKTFLSESSAKIQYGILSGKVDTLTSLPLSFNIAFATALVPAISAAIAKKDYETITKRISFSLLITILIGLPSTVGMCLFAEPILNLLFPNAAQGAIVLQISSITILFTVLAQTVNGALQGIGKVMIPALGLAIGVVAKLICNLILVPIPEIGVNGAAIGSVVCHLISFIIGFGVLKKNVELEIDFKKFILKPVCATIIMATGSYIMYISLKNGVIYNERIITVLSLVSAVILYIISLIILRIFNKDEMYMIPYGNKVYKKLKAAGMYRKEIRQKGI